MGVFGITAEQVIRLKFKPYLDTLDTSKADSFVSDMVDGAGDAVEGQISDLEEEFSSLIKQVPAYIQSVGIEAGNAAAIVANSANPLAATASVSMLISLAAAIQNLISMFNGLKTSYSGLMSGIDKLGIGSLVSPVTTPLTALMGGMSDPEEVVPTPPEPAFEVTVVGGSGSGSYVRDVSVEIVADSFPGQVFHKWVSDIGDLVFEDFQASSTSFVMPISDVTVTALYLPTE